ncbi:MAG TPA: PQQ-dependent sugar dehydrogenase, partial [Chitinophagaceae bacterium]|nr:PQQ-dependent sugar dehydrogenase [Chitinophagaceae bacterium]
MKPTSKLLTLTGMAFVGASLLLPGCKKTDLQNLGPETGTAVSAAKSKQTEALDLQLVTNDFRSPLGVVPFPDNTNRLAVIDQPGQIWIIDANGNKLPSPFIDVSSKMVQLNPNFDERGLLGLAFHPDYATNGRFYLYYTAPPN